MSNNDWYGTESWYEPLKDSAQPSTVQSKKNKKKRLGLRIAGAAIVLVLLIVGSSLAFRDSGKDNQLPSVGDFPSLDPFEGMDDMWDDFEDMPEDSADFFENFYQGTNSDKADIRIPQAKLPLDIILELNEAQGKELSLQELYEKCSKSIVAIAGYSEGRNAYSWGTGVIVSPDGLILTNTHVIDGSHSATVTLFDDRSFEAELVGADTISDVALLKIDAKGLPSAVLGDSNHLVVGDKVAAIGNPLGEEFRMTMTDGIVSAIDRGVNYNGHTMTLLQTNTALNEGNSGGALFNMYGQVVGVTNMKMMSSYSSIEGIGFAIPTATVKSVGNSLLQSGQVRGRPSVGITVGAIPEVALEEYEFPVGLYVSDVTPGSDAEKKGIRVGDIVTHVNGIEVSTTEEMLAIKNEMSVGDMMEISVWRDGWTYTFKVELMDTNDIYK